jgi:hypothetical protein
MCGVATAPVPAGRTLREFFSSPPFVVLDKRTAGGGG